MNKIFSIQWLVTIAFGVLVAVVVIFAILPRLPDIQSATGLDFSIGAMAVDACCDGGDGDGDEDGDGGPGGDNVPSCVLSASPSSVAPGVASELAWTTTNATSGSIDNGVGAMAPIGMGAYNVFPNVTTNYTATVTGPGGATTCNATVTVIPSPPPPQPGTLHFRATLDGAPWSGPITIDFVNDSHPCTAVGFPTQNTGIPAGTYTYSYCTGGPAGAHFTNITPSASQNLSAGASITFTFNFVTDTPPPVQTTRLHFRATLDGNPVPWSNRILIEHIEGRSGCVSVAADHVQTVVATQTFRYCSGGPGDFVSITPSPTQTTVFGGDTTWTFNFVNALVQPLAPTCTLSASTSTITAGSSTTLRWETTNATIGSIDNGVGAMVPIGSGARSVVPAASTTYTATVTNTAGVAATCVTTVTVLPRVPDAPTCTLSATPSFPITAGSSVSLFWTTQNAVSGSIDNGVGSMIPITSGERVVSPTTSTTYRATVVSASGQTATCSAPVTVITAPGALRCDSFTASPSSLPRGGGMTTLRWETTNATSVSIDNGIGTVAVDGSRDVQVQNDTTYTLTARRGTETTTCTTSVDVDEGGGGGGGSSSPRCELFRASDTKVNAGERVTLRWETRRGKELRIEDDRDNEIFETDDTDDVKKGEVTVRPVRDTRYTLTVKKGSRKDTCTVRIDVSDQNIALISDRDQQPLTSISLSQVPYTGFEAGPFLTSVFYTLLTLWAASVAYVLVIKKGAVFGFALRGRRDQESAGGRIVSESMIPHAEYRSYADTQATYEHIPVSAGAVAMAGAPVNLPTGAYQMAYEPSVAVAEEEIGMEEGREGAHLEERANQHNLVLSSDAIRLIMDQADSEENEIALLDEVIARAKATYPREDGWIVLNSERLKALFA